MSSLTKEDLQIYCPSLTKYQRYKTREVNIGGVPLGGNNPIRIQSMTTTDTMDTEATVAQCIRIIEAGADYVRITAPSKKEAENLANIKRELRARGYQTPLVADIHFTPNAAEIAARIVEKVRVNPGNYADKKKFEEIEYTDEAYAAELERIRRKFEPLVKICKEEGTAMRIGTNHGSLSDRIMSRYGDTPLGMVESALEFVRICESMDYYDIVLSMKASNTQIMVQAYRLLMQKMEAEGMNYPLHLGVTEAGDGEDGRIKSAVGIGTLLEDGLGDTVRVSLTEEPEAEIPVAQDLVKRYAKGRSHDIIPGIGENYPIDPFNYSRRDSRAVDIVGADHVPVVLLDYSKFNLQDPDQLIGAGYKYNAALDKWSISDMAADFIYLGEQTLSFEVPGTLRLIVDADFWEESVRPNAYIPLYQKENWNPDSSNRIEFLEIRDDGLDEQFLKQLRLSKNTVLILKTNNTHGMPAIRRSFVELLSNDIDIPVIIRRDYKDLSLDEFTLYSATDLGGLLIDGLGDGVMLTASGQEMNLINRTSFGILQATRTRISKTEYISCPSCGRTLFDLQDTTAMIRARTNHLKGVKIGIMGCIVNGPGEMADADYGYVGSGVGKITLYRGKEVVKRGVPSAQAVDELIGLIQEDGRWVEQATEDAEV